MNSLFDSGEYYVCGAVQNSRKIKVACEQALGEEEGRGRKKESKLSGKRRGREGRVCSQATFPAVLNRTTNVVLFAAPNTPRSSLLSYLSEFGQPAQKPETKANVNKHAKGTMFLDTLRKTGILADKISSFSDRVYLPCATKIRKISEGFNFIVSTRVKRTLPTSVSTPKKY